MSEKLKHPRNKYGSSHKKQSLPQSSVINMSIALASNFAALLANREVRELWNTLDKDGDGKVSSKEWGSKVYQNQDVMKKYFGGSTLSELGHAFNRIDSNKSDNLTWDEFSSEAKSYAAAVKLSDAMKTDEGYADLKALWDTLDKDGDSKVSGKEWGSSVYKNQDVMKKYFGGASLKDLGLAFNRIDIDNNDSLTWAEFCAEVKSYGTLLGLKEAMETDEGSAELKQLYETLDKDGDGKVSSKEWGSAVYKNQDIMKKYFGGRTLEEIGRAFNRIDADNSDSLTWDEFVRDTSA